MNARALLAVLALVSCGQYDPDFAAGIGSIRSAPGSSSNGGSNSGGGNASGETGETPNDCSDIDGGICFNGGSCCGSTCCVAGQVCCNGQCRMNSVQLPPECIGR